MAHHIITLYDQNETAFLSNGLGSLNEAKKCEIYEERNGEFELTMEYPIFGRHFSEIKKHSIIFAKPNPYDKAQPFRVYNISKPMNGMVTIAAHHVSYDLSGYALGAFTVTGLNGVFTEMNTQMSKPWNTGKQPFTFSTDKKDSSPSEFVLINPCNAKALLGGTDASILERYKGEYEWDRWNVILHDHRGEDRGSVVAYGKNMTDFEQEEDYDNVWSDVYPFWYSDDYGLVELDTADKLVACPGEYEVKRTYILDLTSEFQEKPTAAQLKERAEQYIKDNELGSPKISTTISFIDLAMTKNYATLKVLETVKLCDTLRVEFPKMKVSSSTTCIATRYDAIRDKYTEVTLGEPKSSLADTIIGQSLALGTMPTTSEVQSIVDHQTNVITGNKGGYFLIHDSDGDTLPDETLWMDSPDLATAKLVLRINKSGIGFSSTGYNGPYISAWTLDGIFNADFIKAGTMSADRILGGTLVLGGKDNTSGVLLIKDATGKQIGRMDSTGLHFGPNDEFYVDNSGTGTFKGSVYAKNIQAGGEAGHISGSQIGSGAVGADNLGLGSVTNEKVSDGAINNRTITDGAVTNGKLGNGSVTNSKLGDYAVGNGQLATNAVNNRCIQSSSIKNTTIEDNAVSEGKCDSTLRTYFGYAIKANDIFSGKITAADGSFTKLSTSRIQINGHYGAWHANSTLSSGAYVLSYT